MTWRSWIVSDKFCTCTLGQSNGDVLHEALCVTPNLKVWETQPFRKRSSCALGCRGGCVLVVAARALGRCAPWNYREPRGPYSCGRCGAPIRLECPPRRWPEPRYPSAFGSSRRGDEVPQSSMSGSGARVPMRAVLQAVEVAVLFMDGLGPRSMRTARES